MVLIFYKTAKYLGFMRFSSIQKRLNLAAFGTDPNGTKLRVLSMVLIFYKTVKYLGFMRFSSMQKRLNLAAFGTDPLILE